MGNCCDIQKKKGQTQLQNDLGDEQNQYNSAKITQENLTQQQIQANIAKSIEFKEQGNQLIRKQEYQEAIVAYTQAINLYNQDSVYYSNRAVAYRAIKEYAKVEEDSKQAIMLNSENPRAYFLLGTVYLLLAQQYENYENIDKGIEQLNKAKQCLITNPKPDLQISVEYNQIQGQKLIERFQCQKNYKEFLNFKEKLIKRYGNLLDLKQLSYQGLKTPYLPQQLECFTCVITQDIMNEPTLLSSGHSYELKSITECTRVNGPNDPFTREIVKPIFVPNKQLQDAISIQQKHEIQFQ